MLHSVTVKIALFAVILLVSTAFVRRFAIDTAEGHTIEREITDLKDEFGGRSHFFRQYVRGVQTDLFRLAAAVEKSAREEAGTDETQFEETIRHEFKRKSAKFLEKRGRSGDKLTRLQIAVVPLGEDGQTWPMGLDDPTLPEIEVPETSFPDSRKRLVRSVSAPAVPLGELFGWKPPAGVEPYPYWCSAPTTVTVHYDVVQDGDSKGDEKKVALTNPTTAEDVRTEWTIWCVAPVCRHSESTKKFAIVAAVSIQPVLDEWSESARHITFVMDENRKRFLLHPNRLPPKEKAKEKEGIDRLEPATDATFAFSEARSPQSLSEKSDRRSWLEEMSERYAKAEKNSTAQEEASIRRGGRMEEADLKWGSDLQCRYRQTERIKPELAEPLAEKARAEAFDRFVRDLQERLRREVSPLIAIDGYSPDVGRIRIRGPNEDAILQIVQEIDRWFESESLGTLKWNKSVPLERFKFVLTELRYSGTSIDPKSGKEIDPSCPSHSLWMAQAISQDEVKAEATSEMKEKTRLLLVAIGILTVFAVCLTVALGRALGGITGAANDLSKADPESEAWEGTHRRIVERLPLTRRDEIGSLARAFKRMVDEISRGQQSLLTERNGLQRKVEERTAELRGQAETLRLANHELEVARDQAEAASQLKNYFVASVNHELRTPLNHISLYSQHLERTRLDDVQQKSVKTIRRACQYLTQLIGDLLDYQKLELGVLDLEPMEFALEPLLREEVVAIKQPDALSKGLELRCDLAPDLGQVYLAPHRVKQILLNLIGNAIKFTSKGSVTLTARRIESASPPLIEISVSDTGRGMSPEEQANLFKPFKKLSERQGNLGGTGLGLVISKGLALRMHGCITYSSELGHGTTFVVQLPVRMPDEHVTQPKSDKPPTAVARRPASDEVMPSHGSGAILVIDDDRAVRDTVAQFLESRDFKVATAASGEEGLRLAKQLRPSVITLDVMMDGMDGWETLAALKTSAQTADIPVVMVTLLEERGKGYALGVADYLVKPIDLERLRVTLQKYAGSHKPLRVLVIDDDLEYREAILPLLEHDGCEVSLAENGRVGLSQLQSGPLPHLILLDLDMPDVDGFEFVEAFRKNASWSAIPILVVTAMEPSAEARRRLNGSVDRIVHKGDYAHEAILRHIHDRVIRSVRSLRLHTGEASPDATTELMPDHAVPDA